MQLMDNECANLAGPPLDEVSKMESELSAMSMEKAEGERSSHGFLNVTEDASRGEHEAMLVLDLRAVSPTYNSNSDDDDNDDEDDDESSEKLSVVTERPEESIVVQECSQYTPSECDDGKLNRILQERIHSLREVITSLKDELRREIGLWRSEREEIAMWREKGDILALEEATAAARAAAAAYAAEAPLSNDLGDALDIISEQSLRELTILEYEKKLAQYQDALALARAEQRYNAHRHSVARAYKQKLLEVERLCNEELEKIRENASYLQPLKEMASQWFTNDRNRGDGGQEIDSGMHSQKYKFSEEEFIEQFNGFRKIDAEVNMVPEIFVSRFQSESLSNVNKMWPKS